MKRALVCLAAAAIACADASANTAAPSTAVVAGVSWTDANGDQAPVIRGLANPADFNYFDSNGLVWKIDPETAAVSAAIENPSDVDMAYASADCSGTPLGIRADSSLPPLPRITFAADGGIWVRAAGGPVDTTILATRRVGFAQCNVVGPGNALVILLQPANVPAHTLVGPLTPAYGIAATLP